MCKFCENLTNDSEISWLLRNTGADDNICDYENVDCDECSGCSNMEFGIQGYDIKGNAHVAISFYQKVLLFTENEIVIHPYSETIQFNYCPFCGKQISKDVIDFDKIYNNSIVIKE